MLRAKPWSRRDAIRAMVAVAMGGVHYGCSWRGETRSDAFRVDVHHHFFPPRAKELYGPLPAIQDYTPEKSLEEMDRAGVETAVLSLPARLGDDLAEIRDHGATFARDANEFAARVVTDHPGRFRFFAFLPMPNIDATLRELEYALDTLDASGVGLLTSYGNHWLGDSAFRAVFEELGRRGTVVYTHPTDAPCCRGLLPNSLPQTVEWNTDTSRAIWSLINDGRDRPGATVPTVSMASTYSDVEFIWSHAGGSLLGLVGRFLGRNGGPTVDLPSTPEPDSKLHHLRRFYYDTAGSANAIQMQAFASLVGSSQILFGSDYPFLSAVETVEVLHTSGLTRAELAGIERKNALRALSS